jgi:UDP-N-acetylmuramoyl-L-alanyl-D-glutamate--2,6-diaminopimelate ligase
MHWWQAIDGAQTLGTLPAVTDLTHDSRQVRPGGAFVAVPGARLDGHDYLAKALAAGAAVLVVQADHRQAWASLQGRAPLLVVPDSRAALGPLAAAVYDDPSASLRLVGVTGTDGKTTTTHLTAHVLAGCGLRSGYLSSVGFEVGAGFELNASHMTTLEAPLLQSSLAKALAAGRETMVVEASSEGLSQGRLDSCRFDVAVFTNLSRDHLDFHGSMERYLAAKGLLFQKLSRPADKPYARAAVLNADDPASEYLHGVCGAVPLLSYGRSDDVDYQALEVRQEGPHLRFVLRADDLSLPAAVPLIGEFNALNSLAAVAVAASQGVRLREAVSALESFAGIPGRLEPIDGGQPFRVFVDIASTPAALENVLAALRPLTPGRLWVVFGAAGGRDAARREGMGRVAGRLADRSILTNEDPRDEDPDAIIEAIAAGLKSTGRQEGADFERLPDRRQAIARAFAQAEPGDTVLLAGKATETTMIFGSQAVPWDERAVARELLDGRD